MVDKPDLGSGAERRESSSLSTRTTLKGRLSRRSFFVLCGWRDASLREASSVLLGALPLMYPAALCPSRLRFAQTGTGGSPAGSLTFTQMFRRDL